MKLHQRIFLFAALFLCSNMIISSSKAQMEIVTPDTIICPDAALDIHATISGRTPTFITFNSADDYYSPVVPIGFSFNFFGNTYTNCIVSQNGYIKFNTGQASSPSPWQINTGIPGNTNVLNSIMCFYSDILPGTTGTVDYSTVGAAPFRKFVVSFCDASMYSCTALTTSFQLILYETTNIIEMHIANAPNCPGWNGGAAIQGVQNATGTIAYTTPGRNYPAIWTAFQDGQRYTPTSPTNYSITPIPYAPLPNANAPITWYAGGTVNVGSGNPITVTPTGNTFYVAMATVCQDTLRDTIHVEIGGGPPAVLVNPGDPALPTPIADPSICGASDGGITFFGLDSGVTYYIRYKENGVWTLMDTVLSTMQGYHTIPSLSAGVYDSIYIYSVNMCFTGPFGPITLVNPPLEAEFTYDLRLGCDADTLILTNNSLNSPFNLWNFGDGTVDTARNPIHIYPVQGTYLVKLVTSNNFCMDSTFESINTAHPLIAAFTVDDDSLCEKQVVTFTNTSTANNPAFSWHFGDGYTSTTASPLHSYTSPGHFTVEMIVTDILGCLDTASMVIVVDTMPYLSFTTSDSALCEGNGIRFVAHYLQEGNISASWDFGDGNILPNTPDGIINHAYDASGVYNVEFTATYRNCPDAVFMKPIQVQPFPKLDLGRDTVMCPNGEPLVIGDYKNQFAVASWEWNTGAVTPFIAVRHPGIYTAKVTQNHCSTSDSIEVFKDCYIDIPNSFTPNGDGINDYFLPRQLLSDGVVGFKMQVFNRWGQIIFETNRIDGRGWDGKFNDKEQPTGVYVYLIDVYLKNGQKEHYEGNVTLLR